MVAYTISDAQWGYVEAYWPSPKDGSKLDAVTARVQLSPASAVSPVSATPTPAAPRYHVVRRGETLFSIAVRYGVTIRQIVAANDIRNSNRIYPGQRLIIP
jgi:LysM repeat protein